MAAYSTMPATARIHAVADGRKSLAKPMKKLFWMMTVPLSPMSSRTAPFHASRPANVTTKEGTPSFVMITPCSRPMPMPAASATTSAAGQPNTLWLSGKVSRATSTPATPLTKPTDRSISPSSSTNTIPMPMVAKAAAWTMRLTKLPAVRKFEFWVWKTIAMMISPTTIGSEPSSPDLTPTHQPRAYSARLWGPTAAAAGAPGPPSTGAGAVALMRSPPRRRRAPSTACPR